MMLNHSPREPEPVLHVDRQQPAVKVSPRSRSASVPPASAPETSAQLYKRVHTWIVQHQLLRVCAYAEEPDGTRVLTICGLWQIRRRTDETLELRVFQLHSATWVSADNLGSLPVPIGIGKYFKINIHSLFSGVMELIVDPNCLSARQWSKLYNTLVLRQRKNALQKARFAVQNCLFGKIIDHELRSCLLAANLELSLDTYLEAVPHREHILRVAREQRNLLPLLLSLPKSYWPLRDVFSKERWVRDPRTASEEYRPLASRHEWAWLMKAPSSVVKLFVARRAFRQGGGQWLLSVMAPAASNVQAKVPVAALRRAMLSLSSSMRASALPAGDITTTVRLFLVEASRRWVSDGYSAVRDWLASDELSKVIDFLAGTNEPVRRNSTWASLCRQSKEWHDRPFRIERSPELVWKSALPTTELDGIVFSPITDDVALANEGLTMHHCVGSYADDCFAGHYIVFAAESLSDRATLGLAIAPAGIVSVDQLVRHCNQKVPKKQPLHRAAVELARQYQLTITKQHDQLSRLL